MSRVAATQQQTHRHVHSSGRFDRSADQIRRALHTTFTRDRPDVYTSTEAANRRHRTIIRAIAKAHGYTVHQGPGKYDDCLVAVRTDRFLALHTWADALTRLPQNRAKDGPYHHAITVLLADKATGNLVLYTVSHLTAGVERGWGHGTYRERVWRSAHATWSRQTRRRRRANKAAVVMVSDWNLNLEKRRYRALLKTLHPRLRLTWWRFPGPGTHHSRVIDATLTNLTVVTGAHLLLDDASSDHRPYTETLGQIR